MSVFRLTPLKPPYLRGRPLGPCSACTKQIARTDEFVLMYGETFHRDCAFYRSRGPENLERSRVGGLT